MIQKKRKSIKKQRAQSAIEVAILGSIFLFVLGMLLRYGINFSESQNVQYKAFRQALKLSGEDAYSPCPTVNPRTPKGSRLNATTIWIEDRPTVQGGEKYGSPTRSPQMAHGSGTMTTALQLPLEYDAWAGIPVFDMFINGQHFVFRTAWFRRFFDGPPPASHHHAYDKLSKYFEWGSGSHSCTENVHKKSVYTKACHSIKKPDSLNSKAPDYEEIRKRAPYNFGYNVRPPYVTSSELSVLPHPWLGEGINDWSAENKLAANRAFFTKITYNHKKFCRNQSGFSGPCSYDNLSGELDDYRFNLRAEQSPVIPVPPEKRQDISWQWYPVAFSNIGIDMFESGYLQMDLTGDLKEETILRFAIIDVLYSNHSDTIQLYSPQESFSTHRRLKEDEMLSSPEDSWTYGRDHGYVYFQNSQSNASNRKYWFRHPVNYVEFLDYQYGDWDTTYNNVDEFIFNRQPPGIVEQESRIRTIMPQATFEHRQYIEDDTRIIISAQDTESYDIVERRIRLSRHTGCFCPASGYDDCLQHAGLNQQKIDHGPPFFYHTYEWKKPWFCENDNLAVQVYCFGEGCCLDEDSGRADVTCLEYDDKGEPLNMYNDHVMLYVRSVIGTQAGHRTRIIDEDLAQTPF